MYTMATVNDNNSIPIAGKREWIGLAVIALPCVLYSMDLTVLNLAVPHLSKALKPTSSELLWIMDMICGVLSLFLAILCIARLKSAKSVIANNNE